MLPVLHLLICAGKATIESLQAVGRRWSEFVIDHPSIVVTRDEHLLALLPSMWQMLDKPPRYSCVFQTRMVACMPHFSITHNQHFHYHSQTLVIFSITFAECDSDLGTTPISPKNKI